MKLFFWSVGKNHEPYVKEGIDLFTKRIGHYYPCEWKLLPPAKYGSSASPAAIKKSEAIPVLSSLQREDILVALDEHGKQWDSPGLADFIEKKTTQAARNLVFLIGGAYGLDDTVLERAQYRWSLSRLVFPHQLVRLILAEQVYRACTIIKNEKYHHS